MRVMLIIKIGTYCPLRRLNFANARVSGPNPNFYKDDGSNRVHVHFDKSEVKNGKQIDQTLPESVTRVFDAWMAPGGPRDLLLARCDPSQRQRSSQYLLLNNKGLPVTPRLLTQQLPKWTYAAIGYAINPHLLRAILATTVLERDYRELDAVADCLADDPNTVRNHYRYILQQHGATRAAGLVDEAVAEARAVTNRERGEHADSPTIDPVSQIENLPPETLLSLSRAIEARLKQLALSNPTVSSPESNRKGRNRRERQGDNAA